LPDAAKQPRINIDTVNISADIGFGKKNVYTDNIKLKATPAAMPRKAASAPAYHHGDLRRELISQGLALLEEQGLAGLSLRAIAARAGVSHAAPKNHFPHLRALLTAMAAEGFRLHRAAMLAGVSERAKPQARRMAAVKGYVGFAERHPHLFSLMFSGLHVDFADVELGLAAGESYGVLRGIAEGLPWDRAQAANAPLRAEMLLWSVVHGYAQLSIANMFSSEGATKRPKLPVEQIVPKSWG
jgi:AcrR family transcriptional regulator